MKVVIATGLYPPDIGGPATYTKFLERHLPQHTIAYDVASFSNVRKYPKIVRHFVYFLILIKKSRSADIVYALDTVSVGIPAMLVSYLLGKKLYLRVPGDYAWEQGQQRFGITETLDMYLQKGVRPIPVRILAWLQTRVAQRATRVVVPSEYMRKVVGEWGIDTRKVVRIYSALNPIKVTQSKEELRSRFGYQELVIVTAARLTPWKGVDTLIQAISHLHEMGTEVRLEIIGDGIERKNLEALIKEKNAESYIHLHGSLPKQELAERIKASDVFVLNTSYEGLSHQLIEVMDIGTPIVTTPVGGNVELITHKEEGLLVPYNDHEKMKEAILELHTDAMLVKGMVVRAHEKAMLFREENIIPEIVSLFSSLEKVPKQS